MLWRPPIRFTWLIGQNKSLWACVSSSLLNLMWQFFGTLEKTASHTHIVVEEKIPHTTEQLLLHIFYFFLPSLIFTGWNFWKSLPRTCLAQTLHSWSATWGELGWITRALKPKSETVRKNKLYHVWLHFHMHRNIRTNAPVLDNPHAFTQKFHTGQKSLIFFTISMFFPFLYMPGEMDGCWP